MNLKKGVYKHYKGKSYQVIDVVTHSERMEKLVLYKQLYGEESLWVSPLQMFTEKIIIDGKSIARFEFVSKTMK